MTRLLFILAFALISSCVFTQVNFNNLQFQPQYPKRGDQVTITYNPAQTPLEKEKNIEAVVYIFTEKETFAKEIALTRKGTSYSGSFQLDTNARVAALSFLASDKKDGNGNKGYIIPAYDLQKPVAGAGLAYAMIYDGFGDYLFGLKAQPDLAFSYLEKEFNDYPEIRANNIMQYFQVLNKVKKQEAQPLIIKAMQEIEAKGNLPESLYMNFSSWYTRFNMKDKGDALAKEMKEKFPTGNWIQNEQMNLLNKEKDPVKLEQLVTEYIKKFPPQNDNEKNMHSYLNSRVASAYAKEKNGINSSF